MKKKKNRRKIYKKALNIKNNNLSKQQRAGIKINQKTAQRVVNILS